MKAGLALLRGHGRHLGPTFFSEHVTHREDGDGLAAVLGRQGEERVALHLNTAHAFVPPLLPVPHELLLLVEAVRGVDGAFVDLGPAFVGDLTNDCEQLRVCLGRVRPLVVEPVGVDVGICPRARGDDDIPGHEAERIGATGAHTHEDLDPVLADEL